MAMPVHTRIQKLRQFPPGRANVAANNVAGLAYPLGYFDLRPFIDGALHATRDYVYVRSLRFGQIQARGEGRAAPIDRRCDVRIGFIHDTCARYVRDLPGSEEAAAAEKVLRRYFPRGLRAFVQAPYEEELIQLEILVDGLSGPDADLARTLTIGHHLAVLVELRPQYAAALEYEDKVTAGELATAWQAVHQAMIELFCAIVTLVRDPEHQAKVLAPIFDQDDRLAAIYARRRSGQNVEGEIDLDDEVAGIMEQIADREGAPNGEGPAGESFDALADADARAEPAPSPDAAPAPAERPLLAPLADPNG